MNSVLQVYAEFKIWLGEDYGLAEDLLHVHAGLIIFFATALMFQQRLRSLVPILIVYLLAIANEIIDILTPGKATGTWEPLVDILNTVVWPTLLFLLARRRINRNPQTSSGPSETESKDMERGSLSV